MNRFDRHQAIVNQVQELGSVSLSGLVESLRHSPATIRRDLVDLEQEGKVVRTHGGAIFPHRVALEPSFSEKKSRHWKEKERIAGQVLQDIPEGKTVFVDAGTTCHEAGVRLLERGGNHIFTHSIPLLVSGCNFNGMLTALGGEVRSVSRALVGGLSLKWMEHLHFDYALIGASAIEDISLRTTEVLEATMKATAHSRSATSYLLADSSKFSQSAPIEFLKLTDFSRCYVDRSMESELAVKISKRNDLPITRC